METFTLYVWITLSKVLVERRYVPDLSWEEYKARMDEIRADKVHGVDLLCLRSGYPAPRRVNEYCPECGPPKGRGWG